MKTLHVINLKCGKLNRKYNITDKSEIEIYLMRQQLYKPGINFIKIE